MDLQAIKTMTDKEGIVFLSYTGFLSQSLISAMTEALEKEAETGGLNVGASAHVYTIFIEMAQNMMNYSRDIDSLDNARKSEGLIVVGKNLPNYYYVQSQNIIDISDKEKIEPKLQAIQSMSQEEIKQRYRELRKSGRDSHDKGGGIGFYEIAKRCAELSFNFIPVENNKYIFQLKASVTLKKGEQ
jgi:hypothetical protein